MKHILLVDDDPEQLSLRKLLFEHAGFSVGAASSADSALQTLCSHPPEVVLLDLRLKQEGEGLRLIRELRSRLPKVRIAVLSGWAEDLTGREEAAMVDAVMSKPSRSERILRTVARLAVLTLLLTPLFAQRSSFPFQVEKPGEAAAEITMSSPGADWSKPGAEAAVADVAVDDQPPFQVILHAGPERHRYSVFLGALQPGSHRLTVQRNPKYSAPSAGLAVASAAIRSGVDSPVLASAPVLLTRANTLGRFSDIPLTVYAEQLREQGDPILQYTVVFSNEDGGTSTRALMARWGRATDIEYVYRLNQRTGTAIIQSRDHEDIVYAGTREGAHPVLVPVTNNNMVAPASGGETGPRFQLAPVILDLAASSREKIMDLDPVTYRVMAQELIREAKLRPFGQTDGEKISDPRNYLYAELKVANRSSAVSLLVQLRGESAWRSADLGRTDYAISRDGWVRTTIELPPGTQPSEIAAFALQCVVAPPGRDRSWPLTGECQVDAVSQVFLLGRDYLPGKSFFKLEKSVKIPAGRIELIGR